MSFGVGAPSIMYMATIHHVSSYVLCALGKTPSVCNTFSSWRAPDAEPGRYTTHGVAGVHHTQSWVSVQHM